MQIKDKIRSSMTDVLIAHDQGLYSFHIRVDNHLFFSGHKKYQEFLYNNLLCGYSLQDNLSISECSLIEYSAENAYLQVLTLYWYSCLY